MTSQRSEATSDDQQDADEHKNDTEFPFQLRALQQTRERIQGIGDQSAEREQQQRVMNRHRQTNAGRQRNPAGARPWRQKRADDSIFPCDAFTPTEM